MTSMTAAGASTNARNKQSPEITEQTSPQISQTIPNRRVLKTRQSPQKAAGAFRTISEVADELGVEQHVLRFWETKFSQIKPLKRGGGRRYYRPEDVDLLKNIHHLLYQEGYTIKGVQKLMVATRGNLSVRVNGGGAPAAEAASPVARAVEKNRGELQSMLDELKSMRNLIG
jgi:DNA-binding transcriptional MerR regulator